MRAAARRHCVGLGWSLGGTALVCASVILMNQQGDLGGDDAGFAGTAIAVERREAPKRQQPAVRPKPKPQRAARPRAAPAIGIESSLSGLDFGLPQFENDDLAAPADLLGDVEAAVMTGETADRPPRPVAQGPMAFPAGAKAKGITGYVVLSLLIGTDGTVEKVKIVEASPPGVFDDVAASGVQAWRFEPATYQGEPVRVWARQKVSFDLG